MELAKSSAGIVTDLGKITPKLAHAPIAMAREKRNAMNAMETERWMMISKHFISIRATDPPEKRIWN